MLFFLYNFDIEIFLVIFGRFWHFIDGIINNSVITNCISIKKEFIHILKKQENEALTRSFFKKFRTLLSSARKAFAEE